MKKIFQKLEFLSSKQKIILIIAVILTVALGIAVPVYAWFTKQREAVEMFKMEYPNSLYINAAHREDRIYFNLDGIDVNNYLYNADGTLQKDDTGNAMKVTTYRYVFAVSGDNTEKFTLQMAHTNNNMFNYTIYEATQYDSSAEARNAVTVTVVDEEGKPVIDAETDEPIFSIEESRIVEWTQHKNSHTENSIQVAYDEYTDSDISNKYYVRAENPVNGAYKNNSFPASTNDEYYTKNYGTNQNVEIHSVPSYWQADISNFTIDSNKRFVKYFILEVDCKENQEGQEPKETDLIYFTVERKA